MVEWIETPESSNIVRIKYDDETQIMTVEFKNGTAYNYYDVTSTVFEQMKVAPSKGQFLAHVIKGAYRYARS